MGAVNLWFSECFYEFYTVWLSVMILNDKKNVSHSETDIYEYDLTIFD